MNEEEHIAKALHYQSEITTARWAVSGLTIAFVTFVCCCTYYCSQPEPAQKTCVSDNTKPAATVIIQKDN